MNDKNSIWGKIAAVLVIIMAILAVRGGNGGFASFGKAILVIAIIAAVFVVALVIIILYFAFRSGKGNGSAASKVVELDKEEKEILEHARKSLTVLRQGGYRIKNPQVRGAAGAVCKEMDNVLVTLGEKPETISRARQFLDYYLPTTGKIQDKYIELEQKQLADAELVTKVLKYMEDIRLATEKQHKSLYDGDILDLTVEMEVMSMICKRDGILTDEERILPEKQEK